MIEHFDLPQVGRSPARFDFSRLESLNGHYLRQCADAGLVSEIEGLLPHLAGGDRLAKKLNAGLRARFEAAMPGLKERAKTLVELIDSAAYIYAERPLAIDPKAAAVLTPEARGLLCALIPDLESLAPWNGATLEAEVRRFAEQRDLKLGSVAQPLRAALTGRITSPGIFDVLTVLGHTESIARLRDQAVGDASAVRSND
jgi:glutamyl-tRNA synthetase